MQNDGVAGQFTLLSSIERSWYRPFGWTLLLLPLTWFFFMGVRSRHQRKVSTIEAGLSLPVVVVGNIGVGGTGKTPLIITLVQALKKQGVRVGVISRGYGGKASQYPLQVKINSDPKQVGDEPLLIAQHCPVVVDPNRLEAAKYLMALNCCDVILSDDGLQHYALPRDLELVVVDGQRGFGNGFCLPAGPLREPLSRLNTVDALLISGGDQVLNCPLGLPVFDAKILATEITQLNSGKRVALQDFPKGSIHAVSGMGNPQKFIDTLEGLGFKPIAHHYPDHHPFSGDEVQFDDYPVMVTTKDAVKLKALKKLPDNCWVLHIQSEPQSEFFEWFHDKINCLINDKKPK